MKLARLLEGVTVQKLFQTVYGAMIQTHDVEINSVQYDSRKAGENGLFVAIRGLNTDGHRYVQDAIRRKVKAVVVEDETVIPDSICMHKGVVKAVVRNSRVALSRISANYYEHPSQRLTVIGVTGTNGKTTTTHLLASVFEEAKKTVGLIGTIEYKIGNEIFKASHTTPESLELHQFLRTLAERRGTHAVMEVSSHALVHRRVDDVKFAAAVFTNLTQDHLDFHKSMRDYFGAKRRLFSLLENNAVAVVNIDSSYGKDIVEGCRAQIVTYGKNKNAQFHIVNSFSDLSGITLSVAFKDEITEIRSPLLGSFNIYNILAAFSCARALGLDSSVIKKGIAKVSGVRGRFEPVHSPDGWTAIIDYSHTPDALENVLVGVMEIKPKSGRVITVFGCGGDRDRTKRPKMGRIAEELSDFVIVTSDNPRTEDPGKIINEIIGGISNKQNVVVEADRKRAIHSALESARKNDVVLIAGKGHETYQVIGREKIHFNDREVVEEWLAEKAKIQ